MSDWVPNFELGTSGSLSTGSEGSIAAEVVGGIAGSFSGGSSGWGTANRAMYVPVLVRQVTTLYGAFWVNGTTASGNVDVGLYDTSKSKVVSVGSTNQIGISTMQAVAFAATTIAPGLYYLAIAADTTATTFTRASVSAVTLSACGVAQQLTAFPLPSSATFATNAIAFLPMFGFSTESATF